MKKIVLLVLVFSAGNAFSAPMKNNDFDGVKMALQLPLPNRINALNMQGPKYFERLQQIVNTKNESLETRWRALTAMGRMAPDRARPVMEEALSSKDWYMRNAALVVLHYGDRKWAIDWAKKLMDDDALVVRTAAVEALDKMNAIETESLLWEKLYAKENFKNGKSLWIRKHIASILSRFARPGQEADFKRLLMDEDPALHASALKALTKLTAKNLTREQWMSSYQ